MVLLDMHCFPNILFFFQGFICCTGGQSVSYVLLWQPSECVHLIAMITSAEEGGYVFGSVCLSVCLSVRRITRKLVNGF